ncbi:hypothetical protein BCO71033_01735 [Burkholderia contaminans]|uniref:Uncharacterized protein n=1 Tax=Burkholderia contaminans TaxID=488447 RepID=A0A6P2WTT0_9BURK|nr:hypothetical protein BCO71033_01735 [Burkholderia contaminans]
MIIDPFDVSDSKGNVPINLEYLLWRGKCLPQRAQLPLVDHCDHPGQHRKPGPCKQQEILVFRFHFFRIPFLGTEQLTDF